MATEKDILDALRAVQDPDLRRDIVSLGFVRNVRIENGDVRFDINLTTPACPVKDQLKLQAEEIVRGLPGVTSAAANMTAEVRSAARPDASAVAGVKAIIAVASGKGGVGKSTVTVNLAAALARQGARVGILDADIYGPTVPLMMGRDNHIDVGPDGVVIPAKAHGLTFMSMGFMAPGDKPLIWRGPMAHQALQQCLFKVRWGELDYLLIDLPPGTGDVHLTLVQSVGITGAVLVSTPQDIGLTISLKTFRMFETTRVRMLGLIENMSYHVCRKCGERDEIFGHGGAEKAAETLSIPFLGRIPLDRLVREQGDRGVPIVAQDPEHPVSRAYAEAASNLVRQASIAAFEEKPVAVEDE